jgi:hypothetical protein
MLSGGCMCGQVRYEAEGTPYHETICHCSDCRRAAGAASVAWFTVKRAGLRWSGAPAGFKSSEHCVRRFCSACGTSLTFEDDRHPDELDLTTASLDDPGQAPPKDHVYAGSKVGWEAICDGLPAYARTRAEG